MARPSTMSSRYYRGSKASDLEKWKFLEIDDDDDTKCIEFVLLKHDNICDPYYWDGEKNG